MREFGARGYVVGFEKGAMVDSGDGGHGGGGWMCCGRGGGG